MLQIAKFLLPPQLWRAMYEGYRAGGSNTRLVVLGQFGSDAHALFSRRKGKSIWGSETSVFLAQLGLPVQIQFPQYSLPPLLPRPAKTTFAALAEMEAIPFIGKTGRGAYQKFLNSPLPRAFTIGSNGAWGWAAGGEEAWDQAVANCSQYGKGKYTLYAVDNDVVWGEKK